MKRLNLRLKSSAWAVAGSLSVVLFALWLATGVSRGGQGDAPAKGAVQLRPVGIVPGQYIVVFEDDVADPRGLGAALARQNGFALRHSYSFALKGFAARIPSAVAEDLADDPDVAYVEPDLYAEAVAQTVPSGVRRIGADLNAFAAIDGLDDRVDADIAIIDTGIDLNHPDLNVFAAVQCINTDCTKKRKAGNDDNGHGSHVAGIAAALDNGTGAVGVAPGARLWAVKVLDSFGRGNFSDVIKGIDYVTANAGEIEVANMSLRGIGASQALRTAMANSVAAGVVHVVAAGNDSRDVYGLDGVFDSGDDIIPASYPEAMAISALADSDGQAGGTGASTGFGPDDTLASFSNYSSNVVNGNPVDSPGAAIDLAAPGVDIYSAWRGGGYNTISGTSMAAPHAAGAVALEIAAHGRAFDAAGVAAIRQALIDTAEVQALWGPANTNDPDGNPEGLIDIAGAAPPPANDMPGVTITGPANDSAFATGESVSFQGGASDTEDGDLTDGLDWASDVDGVIGSGGSFSTVLGDGVHTITASVTDSGAKTGSDSIQITVGTPPALQQVGVASFAYSTSGGKNRDRHLSVTVTLAPAVGGASVSVAVSGPKSGNGTGTTDSLGSVSFQLNNAPAGSYVTTVTGVSGEGLTWDAEDPANASAPYDKN